VCGVRARACMSQKYSRNLHITDFNVLAANYMLLCICFIWTKYIIKNVFLHFGHNDIYTYKMRACMRVSENCVRACVRGERHYVPLIMQLFIIT